MAFKLTNKTGILGERIVELEYLKRGYILVARNIHNNRGKLLGEIDLVMRTDRIIVFVEVKTRRSSKFGSPTEAVTRQKQRRLIRVTNWFCKRFPQYARLQPRIDVAAVSIDNNAKSVIIIPSAVTLDY